MYLIKSIKMKKNLIILSLVLLSSPIFAQSNETVFRTADVMPVFQECQLEGFENNPYGCTINQLTAYFQDNVVVDNPSGNMSKGLISFIVEFDGSISDISLDRSVYLPESNPELQEELDSKILNLANNISFLSCGITGGENVRVKMQFSVPVNY
jgi:hypothetical protein